MQVVETKSDSLLKDFTVTVESSDLETKIVGRLSEVGKDARIPGFRPGKAPISILKQRFGNSVRGEILEQTIRDSTEELLSERGLRPASQPQIDVTSFEEGEDLTYDISIELLPEIGEVDFSSIELERDKVEATDKEVEDTLQRLADQNKKSEPLKTKRAAKKGDIAVIDYEGSIDNEVFEGGTGKGIELELGANQFIPGFEDQIIGSKSGQSLKVNVTFPLDYGNSELAGKDAVFSCDVKELKQSIPTKIDEEFVKSIGLESIEVLKQTIRDQLNGDYAQFIREKVKRQLLDQLSDLFDFDVPPRMLESEFEQIWKQVQEAKEKNNLDPEDVDKSEEELREQYQNISKRRVRLGLLLTHVGETNDLTVTQEEINRAIMEQARQMPGQEQQFVEFYRSNPEAQASLRAPIFEDKVVNYIIEMATVTERVLSPEELRAETEQNTLEKPVKENKKTTAKKKNIKSNKANAKSDNKKTTKKRVSKPKT